MTGRLGSIFPDCGSLGILVKKPSVISVVSPSEIFYREVLNRDLGDRYTPQEAAKQKNRPKPHRYLIAYFGKTVP
jgi:hypothetical protein